MKKILYGTTALFAVGAIASTAVAADKIKLGLGGYWRGMAQFGNNDSDAAGADDGLRDHGFGQESEIYFSGSTKLDNGIKFGVAVQLEGETSGDQIDNTWIYSSGSFGRVEFGETWGPSLLMSYGSVGEKNHTGDFASFNPQTNLNGLGFNSYGGGAGASGLPTEKLAYYTPRVGGLQVGISYAPEPKNANANGTQDSEVGVSSATQRGSEMIDMGVNYTGKMGGASVAVSTTYWSSSTEPPGAGGTADADVDGYSVGAQVGMNKIKIGGRYTKHNDLNGRGNDRVNWRMGVDYAMGAWSYGFTYQKATQDVTATTEDVSEYMSLGAAYTVGPGIQFGGGIVSVSYDDATNAAGSEGDNNFGILWSKFSF